MKISVHWLIFSLRANTLSAQSPDSGGVRASLDRYTGPATVRVASSGRFRLRVQVNRNGDTHPPGVRVELPKTGRDARPANEVEVRDETGTMMLAQLPGIEWENLVVPIPEKVSAFVAQAVEPSVPAPPATSKKSVRRLLRLARHGRQLWRTRRGLPQGAANAP